MEVCCLLGICCPPLVREKKAIEHFMAKGLDEASAVIAAHELLVAMDALLASNLGALLAEAAKHKHD